MSEILVFLASLDQYNSFGTLFVYFHSLINNLYAGTICYFLKLVFLKTVILKTNHLVPTVIYF